MVSFKETKDRFGKTNQQQVAEIRDNMRLAATAFYQLIHLCDHRQNNAKKSNLEQIYLFLLLATTAKHCTTAAAANYIHYHYDTLCEVIPKQPTTT